MSSNENCFFWNLELLIEGDKSESGSDKEIGGVRVLEFESFR